MTMGQQGPKHVGVDLLKYYCNSKNMCAFVGHTVAISKFLARGTKGFVLLCLIYTDEA